MNDLGRQLAALGAMLAAVAATIAIAGKATNGAGTQTESLAAVESGADHIDAKELTTELLAARGDVLVVDLRPAAEFAAWHLPGAKNLTVPEVVGDQGDALFAAKPRRVVLCSNGPAHPGQAWLALRAKGRDNVRVLAGGLDEWKARMLMPPSLREGATEADAKAELPAWNLMRAFFLGNPAPSPLAKWATDPATLAQPTMVSPHWLRERLGKVAVLDLRAEREFLALHIPGAQRLDLPKLRTKTGDREHLLAPDAQLAQWFGNLGVGIDTPVVLVADDKPHDATLAAMALLRLGHKALAILEGGMLRWATERLPLTADLVMPTAVTYTPRAGGDDFTIALPDLAAAVHDGKTKVLDVRPPDFFKGEKSTEARPGHIPGSVNRLYTKDTTRTGDGQWLRSPQDVGAEYGALGLQKDDAITVSCRTGHQASHAYFVLRYLLGYTKVRWYAGSWTEWAAHPELPAATGDK